MDSPATGGGERVSARPNLTTCDCLAEVQRVHHRPLGLQRGVPLRRSRRKRARVHHRPLGLQRGAPLRRSRHRGARVCLQAASCKAGLSGERQECQRGSIAEAHGHARGENIKRSFGGKGPNSAPPLMAHALLRAQMSDVDTNYIWIEVGSQTHSTSSHNIIF